MMSTISRLRVAEPVQLQSESLSRLQSEQGNFEDVIERTVVDIAERMGAAEHALKLGDYPRLCQYAHELRQIGRKLDFHLLVQVACDVEACADRQDFAALCAVTERMIRVGDASLAAAIDGACFS